MAKKKILEQLTLEQVARFSEECAKQTVLAAAKQDQETTVFFAWGGAIARELLQRRASDSDEEKPNA